MQSVEGHPVSHTACQVSVSICVAPQGMDKKQRGVAGRSVARLQRNHPGAGECVIYQLLSGGLCQCFYRGILKQRGHRKTEVQLLIGSMYTLQRGQRAATQIKKVVQYSHWMNTEDALPYPRDLTLDVVAGRYAF